MGTYSVTVLWLYIHHIAYILQQSYEKSTIHFIDEEIDFERLNKLGSRTNSEEVIQEGFLLIPEPDSAMLGESCLNWEGSFKMV